jgi:hypothetical protein
VFLSNEEDALRDVRAFLHGLQQRMTRAGKTAAILIAVLMIALTAIVFALFHGYFDRGKFEIRNAQWSESGQVAMLVERSDHQALSSDVYFVLIGNHLFSPRELRQAYHSPDVFFAAAADCLTLHWSDSHNLTVTCAGGSINRDHIEVQRRQSGDVNISYVNIPDSDVTR